MILTLVVTFVFLLLVGMPIAMLLIITTAVCLTAYTSTSLIILPIRLFDALDNFILMSIPFFILAGTIMTEGAMARRLIAVVNAFIGPYPGGLAVAATLACLFFAALSGSSPATVVAIGSIMIPALIKAGYDERFSIGLLTSAGSLGIVIPPSIPMILYCLVMNVSVAELFMAGIVPGFLIGGSFIVYTLVMAYRRKWFFGQPVPWGEKLSALREGIWGLMLPVLVLGGIYSGVITATEAAAVSVVYALFVEIVVHKEFRVRDLPRICGRASVLSGCLLFILAAAMVLIWLLTSQRLPHQMADFVTTYVQNWWQFLIIVNVLFLLLGTVMDNVSAMMILSPLFAETLARFGIDPVHYGIIMVLVIEYGFVTPPFGLNLFVAMGLTDKSLTEVAISIWPFLVLLLGCLLIVTFVPSLSTWLPYTLLR